MWIPCEPGCSPSKFEDSIIEKIHSRENCHQPMVPSTIQSCSTSVNLTTPLTAPVAKPTGYPSTATADGSFLDPTPLISTSFPVDSKRDCNSNIGNVLSTTTRSSWRRTSKFLIPSIPSSFWLIESTQDWQFIDTANSTCHQTNN